ncbi:MAG: hypothetical protein HYW48_04725 [Deltaproteobacteria bacterium]|nr:hypothetical protein [Deltaproteobacteria bacterium]
MEGSEYRSRRKLRNFLLQPMIQLKLGLYSILISAAFGFFILYILYQNLSEFVDVFITASGLGVEIKELFVAYLSQTKWWLALLFLAFLLINVGITIIYTHRMVGPTVAFRRHIGKLRQGDYTSRIFLRKGDAFQEVADDLNELAKTLEHKADH